MRWRNVVEIALRWPEVAEATSYGEPSLKVRKRLLARHRPKDDSLVLLDVPHEERAHLIEVMAEAFFCEPHYADHDIVLARLPHAPPEAVARLLERRWRSSATQRSVAAFDR
jgi:hypothetical protein